MNSKHTPGPWSVWSDDLTIRAGVLNIATISEFVSSTTGDGNYDVLLSEEQAEANARLIAAAPELLEALEGIANHYHMDGYGEKAWKDLALEMADLALAAIAKSTGESQ